MIAQTEEEEHCSVLSVAEVRKPSGRIPACDHFTQEPNKCEEHLEEAFPFPAAQRRGTTADEVHWERH